MARPAKRSKSKDAAIGRSQQSYPKKRTGAAKRRGTKQSLNANISPAKPAVPVTTTSESNPVRDQNMADANLEQRVTTLENRLREVGELCLQIGEHVNIRSTYHGTAFNQSLADSAASSNPSPAAGVVSLSQFLLSVQDLNPAEQLRVVEAATEMIGNVFAHLPLKRAMHGIDPLQRLRLLQYRVAKRVQNSGDSGTREFHDEMIEIFHSLRDLHTNYILPASFQGKTAFLPFIVQEYFNADPLQRSYIVTRVVPGFTHDTFKVGVTVTHWNGIPIDRAIELNAAREAGSNDEARHARGLESLTLRSMTLAAPPDETWVIIGYESNGQPLEIHFTWQVTGAAPPVSGADANESLAMFGAAGRVMGFDATTIAVHRARKSIFFPEAIGYEHRMAVTMAAAAAPATFDVDAKGEVLRHAKRALCFSDMKVAEQGVQAAAAVAASANTATDDPQTNSLLPEFFTFRKVQNPSGTFGYIRIYTFMAYDANAFVAEFVRIADVLQQNNNGSPFQGLIVDVRGNGGGNIWAGEQLLQVLTPSRIEPEKFQFINTDKTLKLCQLDPTLTPWVESIDLSLQTGEIYSQGFPLTTVEMANSVGQKYNGKVLLITDALCYSTTDIFTAGFQDHKIGKILGVSARTGAGGANVWTYDLFAPIGFAALPKGVSFRTAIRRSTRVGDKAGVPLEDLGVTPDAIHRMTRRDILESNADLIAAAVEMLSN